MYTQSKTRPAASGAVKGLERPRYYPRQIVTSDDLSESQAYFRERLRRHNRALHGWGVVHGASVQPVFDPDGAVRTVSVLPGLILTPQGDEIEITAATTFNASVETTPGDPSGSDDPWYSEVYIDRRGGDNTKYLAVRYVEALSRPVRVTPSACDCGGANACEYSRYCDSYTLSLLDTLPPSHSGAATVNKWVLDTVQALADLPASATLEDQTQAIINHLFGATLPGPPPVVSDPWVVLASLHFDGNVIVAIDPISDRRLMVSLAGLSWRPVSTFTPLAIADVPAATAAVDAGNASRATVDLIVTGGGLMSIKPENVAFQNPGAKLQVDGVTPDSKTPDANLTIQASFDIAGSLPATPAPLPGKLILSRSDGAVAISPAPVTITIPGAAAKKAAAGGGGGGAGAGGGGKGKGKGK
jgi:hypothetical protein